MDLFEAITKRRSIRSFQNYIVPDDAVDKILDAARLAPTGLNLQPWEFIVINDPERKKKVREVYDEAREKLNLYPQDTTFVEIATNIIVLGDKRKATYPVDPWFAIENMLLAATALSLGSIVMTAPVLLDEHKAKLRDLMAIPASMELIAVVLVGYPAEQPEPKEKRPLEDIKHVDMYHIK